MSNKGSLLILMGIVVGIVGMLFAAHKIEFSNADLKKLAKEAYIWGYPLVVMERTKNSFTQKGKTPLNKFKRFDQLVTPSFTEVVTPNVDTLYASAWLDLTEAVVLSVPDTNDRYYVIQFLDAYTNVFKNIGKRTTGTKQGTYLIVGPSWSGKTPEGMTLIQSPTKTVWLIARILVKGPDDVASVRKLLSRIKLTGLSAGCPAQFSQVPKGSPLEVEKAGIEFFDELSDALLVNPAPATQKGLVELFNRLGIAPGKKPSVEIKDPELRTILTSAVAEGEKEIDAKIAALGSAKTWSYNLKTGTYGDDYLLRAAVAKQGLGANVAEESVYPIAHTDSDGKQLSGSNSYVVHFDSVPPVEGFWSLTMYDSSTRLLVPNNLSRYALSDRSQLTYNKDGSLDILVQHTAPKDTTNWLPAPTGDFYLVLRQYMPKKAVLEDTYSYPVIKKSS